MLHLPKVGKSKFLPLLSTLVIFLSIWAGVVLVQKQQEIRERAATAPSAVSTFHSIGLYWSLSGGSSNNSATVQYREKGTSTWRQGLELWFDSGSGEYRGSLVHLEPATTYEIKLTLKSGTTKTLTAATWSENFPIAKTIELPKLSNKTLVINQSGTPNGYILYTHAPGSSATIDGGSNNIEVRASYVIIRGLTLKNARNYGIQINNTHDVVIEENDISSWGSGSNYESAIRSSSWDDADIERIIIQRNRMHHPRSNSNNWSTGHPQGPQAVALFNSRGNHVIRYNEVFSDKDHYYNDILGAGSNFSTEGFPNRDSDIYGNYLANCWDDAIETEGGNRNVRVWGNYIENCMMTIANRDTTIGPLYIWRNISNVAELYYFKHDPLTDEKRGRFLKAGGPARTYLFHNTMLQPPPAGGFKYPLGASNGIGGDLNQSVSRNNIFQVNRPDMSGSGWYIIDAGSSSNDFDYDLYKGSNRVSSGQETNGIKGVPKYNPTPSFTLSGGTGGKGTFTLDSSSLGFNAGAIIPNFNDGYTGSRPDVGAHESGTAPMEFGVDAYRTGTPPPPPPPGSPTPTPTKVPTPTPTPTGPTPTPPPIPGNAFRGLYYDGENFNTLKHTRIDPAIDFDWGLGSPAPGVGVDSFSVRWEGDWNFTQAGTYRFTSETDDGMRVFVDGQQIIDAWKNQPATIYTGDIQLSAGTHRVKVEYYEAHSPAVARLSWALTASSLPGDINDDGAVNILDYQLLTNNFGSTNCGNVADIDGDCDVDIFDYNTLVENFGRSI